MKTGLKSEEVQMIRKHLKALECWPGYVPYKGVKFKLCNWIFSNEILYKSICCIYKIIFIRE